MTERDLERKREQERGPVEEAGGGEAEGFEQAEEQLERNASHEDAGEADEATHQDQED